MAIVVLKASGKKEKFDETKIRNSLKRVGAKPDVINKILISLTNQLHGTITTKEIYKLVFNLLNQYQSGQEYRYSLKNALFNLGPSGYPFENFIARLLDKLGYTTQTQTMMKGKCIEHEIDIIAKKDNQVHLVECKFHNRQGIKTRVKEALYTQARFEDLKKDFNKVWLVTNTRLTTSAIKYGSCKKMDLLAWNYPKQGSLEQLIEKHNLHPLTCFNFLSPHDLKLLFQNNLVLCQDLSQLKEKQLQNIGLNSAKINQIKTALSQLHF
ncbi:MAG: restriction endonuclease [Patescibacteria group bacterium]|nr:restriction endonuclease [Patescibacteria group bacterium]